MVRLLPLVAGAVVGALGLKLAKSEQVRSGFRKAEKSLREATSSGLDAVKSISDRARQQFSAGAGTKSKKTAKGKKPVRKTARKAARAE